MVLCGGIDSSGPRSQVYGFSYSEKPAWSIGALVTKPDMNVSRHSFAIYHIAGIVYVFGGDDTLEECECLSLVENKWAALPRLPFP
jgi:hypothetical protein